MTFVYQRVFLDSTIFGDYNILYMDNITLSDHLDNMKRGGVCLYFKKSLAIRKIELSKRKKTSGFHYC